MAIMVCSYNRLSNRCEITSFSDRTFPDISGHSLIIGLAPGSQGTGLRKTDFYHTDETETEF